MCRLVITIDNIILKETWMRSYLEVTDYILFLEGGRDRMENRLALSFILLVAKISPVISKTYDKASVGKLMKNVLYNNC
jgi:hypothetical protein